MTIREILASYMEAVNKSYEEETNPYTDELLPTPYPNISSSVDEFIMTRKTFPLGYCNGWRDEENDLYFAMSKIAVAGSHKSHNVGRCISESSFVAFDGVDTITITYGCDSSD